MRIIAGFACVIFKAASSDASYKGVLEFSDEPLVSCDIIGNPHSCIFDSKLTLTLGDRFVKVVGWYDNEWGYSNRCVEMLEMLAHHPSTAKFISRKLAMRFVSDNPPQSLIDKMADTFKKKDGDIREVLKTMFNVGDVVEIEAYIAKDGSKHLGLLHGVRFADGHQILFGRAEDSEGKN